MRECGGRCALCERIFVLERSHIAPLSEGGSNSDDNMIMLCRTCEDKVERKLIPRDVLRKSKAQLVASPRVVGWALDKAFTFEIGSNPLFSGNVLVGVDDSPVVWHDPDGVATGLCADFCDRKGHLVMCIRDGVWEADNPYALQTKELGDEHYWFRVVAARTPGTRKKERVSLSFVVQHYTLHLENAVFWVSGHRIEVTEESLAGRLSSCLVFAPDHEAALWAYTPRYQGARRKALLSIQL